MPHDATVSTYNKNKEARTLVSGIESLISEIDLNKFNLELTD